MKKSFLALCGLFLLCGIGPTAVIYGIGSFKVIPVYYINKEGGTSRRELVSLRETTNDFTVSLVAPPEGTPLYSHTIEVSRYAYAARHDTSLFVWYSVARILMVLYSIVLSGVAVLLIIDRLTD